ncbi:MAG: prepilin-type N-terminal cleavage/methylation domain-containing protein [Halomonas sp.]|nr:prepilin-type N-terminal cleavage/methylation domain-containing protein [Halomonas sp.]MBP5980065.1 prepilin-type N-terminal cleavage/methylation domain-containing protein [Halomonas sp.]
MQRQRGFTLVEALIALALLVFGLMGIAAMQLTSLQSATTGYQYSAASLAAVDMQESAWGRLATTQNCRRIDLASLRSAWRAQWFEGLDAPLNGSTGEVERAVVDGSCHFTVSIVVNAWPSQEVQEPLDYVFTLPLSEGA